MRETRTLQKTGDLIASALNGVWRSQPPPLELTGEELAEIAPLLLGSSAGALGWWKVRGSVFRKTPAGQKLQDAYRFYNIENVANQRALQKIFLILRNENIEPILIKGWAAAHYYPEPALRPYRDFDLVVPPGREKRAAELLKSHQCRNVDLEHYELSKFDNRSYAALSERSRLIDLNEVEIRVPCPEDHLRLICIHLLKHGGSRPLWLCDVAAAVETRPCDFDWDRCLGIDRRRARWIIYTIGLADRLLGACIEDTPVDPIADSPPLWMERSIKQDWSTPKRYLPLEVTLMTDTLRKRKDFFSALRQRWPNPIEATVLYKGSFNRLTTWTHQLRYYIEAAFKFASKMAIPISSVTERRIRSDRR